MSLNFFLKKFFIVVSVFCLAKNVQANSFSGSLIKLKDNLYYRAAILPSGTIKLNDVSTDALDKAMFDVTYETHAEVATIELLNENGEVLAIKAHTQGRDSSVGGKSARKAIDSVVAEMNDGGWVDSVKKVRIRHTHPPEGTYSSFSPADRRMLLYLKAYFDLNFGRSIVMESQLIFSKVADRPRKKVIVIPESISLQKGDYKTDSNFDQYQGIELDPSWIGRAQAASIELSDQFILNTFQQLSEEVWGPEYEVTTELGRKKRLLVLSKKSLGSHYYIDNVKNTKVKSMYLFHLHNYLSDISNPTSILDYYEAKSLIQETMSAHFPNSDNFIDVLVELIDFNKVAKNNLRNELEKFDILSVGWHHDAVLRSIIVISKFSGASNKTRALLEAIAGYFSETGRFAKAVLNEFQDASVDPVRTLPNTCEALLIN